MSFFDESVQTEKVAILNFSKKYCTTVEEIFFSKTFKEILEKYLINRKINKRSIFKFFEKIFKTESEKIISKEIILFLKMSYFMELKNIAQFNSNYKNIFKEKNIFLSFIESFYNYWRKIQRFSIIIPRNSDKALEVAKFAFANDDFKKLILKTYRHIEEKFLENTNLVYRQLNAGVNASMILKKVDLNIPSEYKKLEKIYFIEKIFLDPPFIFYPKQNKRKGVFNEVNDFYLDNLIFDNNKWLALALKVGKNTALFYFHVEFISMAISLVNLFELENLSSLKTKKPELIYIFGYQDNNKEKIANYFIDKKNSIYFGYANNHEEIDYFGYIKKLLLTLHNVKLIHEGLIPLHGAMVNLTLKNGITKNIAIIGDSGAGKSESLEAFRQLAKDYISEMNIIFDDMGYFTIENNKIFGYGTEIGAFIRIDDLEKGYPYEQIDRSIFMNPNKNINARMVIPITTYDNISKGFEVDAILQANNFDESESAIKKFNSIEKTIEAFTKGTRMAKGTTSEKGLVDSYFSNPFGPLQEKEKTDKLIKKYFKNAFDNNLFIGEIRTELGIKGKEQSGPLKAGKQLFNMILKNKI